FSRLCRFTRLRRPSPSIFRHILARRRSRQPSQKHLFSPLAFLSSGIGFSLCSFFPFSILNFLFGTPSTVTSHVLTAAPTQSTRCPANIGTTNSSALPAANLPHTPSHLSPCTSISRPILRALPVAPLPPSGIRSAARYAKTAAPTPPAPCLPGPGSDPAACKSSRKAPPRNALAILCTGQHIRSSGKVPARALPACRTPASANPPRAAPVVPLFACLAPPAAAGWKGKTFPGRPCFAPTLLSAHPPEWSGSIAHADRSCVQKFPAPAPALSCTAVPSAAPPRLPP